MKYLLDTHSLIWFLGVSKKLPAPISKLIRDPKNNILASVASFWEIAIKMSVRKIELPFDISELEAEAVSNNILVLDILVKHALIVADLPFHHKDPFDRIIIAQAMSENIVIISSDKMFDNYPVRRVW